ncbi:MAG: hypothetical protein ABIW82_07280 [Dokdonella sp.]
MRALTSNHLAIVPLVLLAGTCELPAQQPKATGGVVVAATPHGICRPLPRAAALPLVQRVSEIWRASVMHSSCNGGSETPWVNILVSCVAALLLLATFNVRCEAQSSVRDQEIAKQVNKYSVSRNCTEAFLEDFSIPTAVCAAKVAQAKEDCPAIVGKGLPAELDDNQRYRVIARSHVCIIDTILGKDPDIGYADGTADALWEKVRPRDVDPAIALQNLEQIISVSRPAGTRRARIEFYVAATRPDRTTRELTDLGGSPLYIENKPFITAPDIVSVDVVPASDLNYSAIQLHYSPSAARRLQEITTARRRGKMAVLVDGKILVVLNWFLPLGSSSMFSNSYDRHEAMRLAQSFAP